MKRLTTILDTIIFEGLLPLIGMVLSLFLLLVVVASTALFSLYTVNLLAGWLFP